MTMFPLHAPCAAVLDPDFDDEAEDMANCIAVLRGDYRAVRIRYGAPIAGAETGMGRK